MVDVKLSLVVLFSGKTPFGDFGEDGDMRDDVMM